MSGSRIDVTVKAELKPNGVNCEITCNGQAVTAVFNGVEVFIEVPGPDGSTQE